MLYPLYAIPNTQYDLLPMMPSWRGDWSVAAVRAMRRWRRHVLRPARAGYNYYAAAVPGMVAPVGDAAGKGDYQDSEDDCQN